MGLHIGTRPTKNNVFVWAKGQALYDTPGTYTWIPPSDLLSFFGVSVVCVGGGGGGSASGPGTQPGQPTNGSNSSFSLSTTTLCFAEGGKAGIQNAGGGVAGGAGGTVRIGDGGTNGNTGPVRVSSFTATGGGGAGLLNGSAGTNGAEAQWAGSGGQGASVITSGGGAAGGGPVENSTEAVQNGVGGNYGGGGAGGRDGTGAGGGAISYTNNILTVSGGEYTIVVGNKGLGKDYASANRRGANGAIGVVRIIWPANDVLENSTRVFPSTNIADV